MNFRKDLKLRFVPGAGDMYSWSIDEVDDNNQRVGHRQTPLIWSLSFTVSEIVLGDRTSIQEAGDIEGWRSKDASIVHSRSLVAKLRPGEPHARHPWQKTTFRMFGSDAPITDFQLHIESLEGEDETETCRAWARDPDWLAFYMMVRPSTFQRYAGRIADGTADEIVLRVERVDGFYSQPDPPTPPSDVKVLRGDDRHVVDMPEGSEFKPLRMGRVGKAELLINTKRVEAEPGTTAAARSGPRITPLVRPEVAARWASGLDQTTLALLRSLSWSGSVTVTLLFALVIILLRR